MCLARVPGAMMVPSLTKGIHEEEQALGEGKMMNWVGHVEFVKPVGSTSGGIHCYG